MSNIDRTTDHRLDVEYDRTHADGNMWTATPVCPCGWRGYPVASYNDDQWSTVRRQFKHHQQEQARA